MKALVLAIIVFMGGSALAADFDKFKTGLRTTTTAVCSESAARNVAEAALVSQEDGDRVWMKMREAGRCIFRRAGISVLVGDMAWTFIDWTGVKYIVFHLTADEEFPFKPVIWIAAAS